MIAFNALSGLMMRPMFNLFFLMESQIFFVTSVRGIDFPPQMAANAGLSVFGAKRPTPFFFMAAAIFLPLAFEAFLPAARFSAVIFLSVAFVTVFFVVFATVVFAVVLVVISSEERMQVHAGLEP